MVTVKAVGPGKAFETVSLLSTVTVVPLIPVTGAISVTLEGETSVSEVTFVIAADVDPYSVISLVAFVPTLVVFPTDELVLLSLALTLTLMSESFTKELTVMLPDRAR